MGSFRDSETQASGGTFRQMDMAERTSRKPPKRQPTLNPITNWARTVGDAGKAFVENVREDYNRAGERMREGAKLDRRSVVDAVTLKEARKGAGTVLSGVGAALSPITGVFEAGLVKPYGALHAQVPFSYKGLERVTGDEARANNRAQAENAMRLGLSAIRPAPGYQVPQRPSPSPTAKPTPEDLALGEFAKRAKIDPPELRANAAELRRAGIEPTLTDVSGDRGRRIIRAVGAKTPEAGEALANRSRAVTADAKPAVMQGARRLTPELRTADELADAIRVARTEAATRDYAGPYSTAVPVDETIRTALSGDAGRAALMRARQAAAARLDNARVAEIDALLGGNADEVSAAALHRARIAMRGRGERLAQNPATRDIASGLQMRGDMLDDALNRVPGMEPANQAFRAQSQALDVLGKKRFDIFSTDPTDYQAWLGSLSNEAREANKVAIRQEILDTLGGQRSSSFGSLDQLASSQYARRNLAAALGEQEANSFLGNITARLDQVRNASMVSPNANSRTAVLENDVERLSGLVEAGKVGADVFTGNLRGAAGRLASQTLNWLRARGINDDAARMIAEAASDPAKLDEIIRALEAAQSGSGKAFLAFRQQLAQAGRSVPTLLPVQQRPRLLEAPRLATQAAATPPPQREDRR